MGLLRLFENPEDEARRVWGRGYQVFHAVHATSAEFSAFDPSFIGRLDPGWMGEGFYFTPLTKDFRDKHSRDYGGGYSFGQIDHTSGISDPKLKPGARNMPVLIRMKKPFTDQDAENPSIAWEFHRRGYKSVHYHYGTSEPWEVKPPGQRQDHSYRRTRDDFHNDVPEDAKKFTEIAMELGYDGAIWHGEIVVFPAFAHNIRAMYGAKFNPDMADSANIMEARQSTFRVFHGSPTKFKTFQRKYLGTTNGTAPINMKGFNFTDDVEVAKSFGPNVIECDVTITRPYVIDAKGAGYDDFKDVINDKMDRIKAQHDGIIVKNFKDAGTHPGMSWAHDRVSNHYVPFREDQIKIVGSNILEGIHDEPLLVNPSRIAVLKLLKESYGVARMIVHKGDVYIWEGLTMRMLHGDVCNRIGVGAVSNEFERYSMYAFANLFGVRFGALGRPNEEIPEYTQVARNNPNITRIWGRKVVCIDLQGEPREAVDRPAPTTEHITEAVKADIAARILKDLRVERGVKIPKSARLWRGVSEESGHGMATYGLGLYFTCDKKTAAQYGTVVELDASVLPTNCLRFRSPGDFQIWFQTAWALMGFKDQRDVWKQYNGMDEFVRAIDPSIDGIQIYTGKDAMFVKYPDDGASA